MLLLWYKTEVKHPSCVNMTQWTKDKKKIYTKFRTEGILLYITWLYVKDWTTKLNNEKVNFNFHSVYDAYY